MNTSTNPDKQNETSNKATEVVTSEHDNNNDDNNNNNNNNWDLLLDRLKTNSIKFSSKLAVAYISPGPDGGKIERQLTYNELEQQTTQLANKILSNGLRRGDRAVLVYPPSLDFMIAFLACLKAGVIAVPVFPPNPLRRDTLQMFSVIVKACDASFALTCASYNHQKKLSTIKDALTKFRRSTTTTWPESLKWIVTDKSTDQNLDSSSITTKINNIDRSDIAFLQFTSGSTSDPKGVMITHDNLAHNLTIITNELKASEQTVVVSWLPQYHDMGLIGSYLGILYCGGTGYYMSPLSFLQRPMLWIEAISKYNATHLQAPNFAFKLTARKFDTSNSNTNNLNLSSVQHVINAAEPVDQDSIETFYKTFGPYGFKKVIYPTYGLAEHTVFVCSGGKQIINVMKKDLEVDGKVILCDTDPTDKSTVSTLVGCGYPANQNVDVRIVNTETFEISPEDIVGEIWVRSPSKAAGYYHKPTETKEDFHAKLSSDNEDGEGFLRTGDLGFLHQKELFICGRLKDLIIVGGRNYYPQDIEVTAESASDLVRPGCSAAFTIDTTHDGGEEVALVMELKDVPPSSDVENVCGPLANEIRSAINQEHSLGIASIAFLKTRTVPKTSSGKIARAWCRKGYLNKTLQIVYHKSFKLNNSSPLEVEQENGVGNNSATTTSNDAQEKKSASEIRAMSKEEIAECLIRDLSRVGSLPADAIDKKAPLVTMLDSLTLSQFKGMLENNYAVKMSDEYLFRESTTVTKLVEVVKLGYAPDDGEGDNAASTADMPGQARGLAGALGCPPGVVCVIL